MKYLSLFLCLFSLWAFAQEKSEKLPTEYCQVSTIKSKCLDDCIKRRAVNCFTKEGVISGFVDYQAKVLMMATDGKVVEVNKPFNEFLSKDQTLPKQVQVFSFEAGTKIYDSADVKERFVLREIQAVDVEAPSRGGNLARINGSQQIFSCISNGVSKKRCLSYIRGPRDPRYLSDIGQIPVITEVQADQTCDDNTVNLMEQFTKDNQARQVVALTGTQEPNSSKTELVPIMKKYKLNLSVDTLPLQVKYENNLFVGKPDELYFQSIKLGKFEFTTLELAKFANDDLKNALLSRHHSNLEEVPPQVLRGLVQAALKEKYKLKEADITKALSQDAEFTPGAYDKDEAVYVRKMVPQFYSNDIFGFPTLVCPGAAKGDFFYGTPAEYNSNFCDEPIVIGERMKGDGTLQKLACFVPKEIAGAYNGLYCPKPSACAKDEYSVTKQKFVAKQYIKRDSKQGTIIEGTLKN